MSSVRSRLQHCKDTMKKPWFYQPQIKPYQKVILLCNIIEEIKIDAMFLQLIYWLILPAMLDSELILGDFLWAFKDLLLMALTGSSGVHWEDRIPLSPWGALQCLEWLHPDSGLEVYRVAGAGWGSWHHHMVPTGLRMDEKTWAPCHDRKSRQGDPGSSHQLPIWWTKGGAMKWHFWTGKGRGWALQPRCSQIWGRGDQVGPSALSVHPLGLLSVSDWGHST